MAVNSVFRFYALRFNNQTSNSGGVQMTPTLLGGISTSAVDPEPEVVQEFVDGSPMPTQTTLRSIAEKMAFTTNNIDTAIDIVGTTGTCFTFPGSLEVFYARYDSCSTGPAPGSVHRKVTVSAVGVNKRGLVYPTSLNCDHQGDAQFSFSVAPQSDGVNAAFQFDTNVSLPAGPIDNTNRYTIGPVEIGGVLIDGIKSINTDFGITVEKESADSAIFSEYFSISQLATKVSVAGINPGWWDASRLGAIGTPASHSDTSIILRRRLNTGSAGFEPAAEQKHFRMTAAGLAVPSSYFGSSGSSPVTSSFDLYTHHDGINVPLFANTNIAY